MHYARNVFASGAIEWRDVLLDELDKKLTQARKTEVPYLYAQAGVWYDALAAISELVEDAPCHIDLLQQRAALLEQIGLREAAAYDLRRCQ